MSGVIRLDPQILEHRKFIRAVRLAGSAAVHLWLGLRAWAQQHPDNGFIPEDMVGESRGPKRARDRQKALQALLDSELLEKVHGGVVIHDILDWADSAEKVEEQREKWRRNKRAQRSRSPDSAAKPEPSGDQAATKRRPNTNQTRPLQRPSGDQAATQHEPNANANKQENSHTARVSTVDSPRRPKGVRDVSSDNGNGNGNGIDPPLPPNGGHGVGLVERAKRCVRDPFSSRLDDGPPESWPECKRLAELLSQTFGCSRPEFRGGMNNPGLRCIVERFAEGHELSQLESAIRGSAMVDHIANAREFQTLQTILRDAGQVSKFARMVSDDQPAQKQQESVQGCPT